MIHHQLQKVSDKSIFPEQLLTAAKTFENAQLLMNFSGKGAFDFLFATGSEYKEGVLDLGKKEIPKEGLYGFLGYDLKNKVEPLVSDNPDMLSFPDSFLFKGTKILLKKAGVLYQNGWSESELRELAELPNVKMWGGNVNLEQIQSEEDYLASVERLKQHIQRGDIYEINYCMPFSGDARIDPYEVFLRLVSLTKAPFTGFLKFGEKFILSASPERYLQRMGKKIISQPIKGTSPRFFVDEKKDLASAERLLQSEKERAENVMIVDLVRNDLSRIARKGSVKVEELFGIYSFPTVHQMISTISAEVDKEVSWEDIVSASFPMGSMTGAPKIRAMELIEEYEVFKRGPYSGAMGYILPNGDFDLNVLIRSLFYNNHNGKLMAGVGGAITNLAKSNEEYQECLLKVQALKKALAPNRC